MRCGMSACLLANNAQQHARLTAVQDIIYILHVTCARVPMCPCDMLVVAAIVKAQLAEKLVAPVGTTAGLPAAVEGVVGPSDCMYVVTSSVVGVVVVLMHYSPACMLNGIVCIYLGNLRCMWH